MVKEKKYFHIDNGGYTFWVSSDLGLSVACGFFGYIETQTDMIHMNADKIKELGVWLIEQSATLKKWEDDSNR